MTKIERLRRAFQGWWDRSGNQFAITPEPRDDVRFRIARHAFEAGWTARGARSQKQAIRTDEAAKAARRTVVGQFAGSAG